MTDKEKVLAKWPDAIAFCYRKGDWSILKRGMPWMTSIGYANTEPEAWADAARRMDSAVADKIKEQA